MNLMLLVGDIGMWINDLITRSLLVLSVILLLACTQEIESKVDLDKPKAAWWYDIDFDPKAEVIHGIDIHAINKRWRHAHGLEPCDLEDRISQDSVRQFMASPLSFSVSADLDSDGVSEEFFVGVFETTDGNKGRFVVITKKGISVQHFVEEGNTGFSALIQGKWEVRWYKCMECDEFESITWTGKSYALE